MFLGQLWRYTNDGRLVNQNGISLYFNKKWKIPDIDQLGTIEDQKSGKVLSLTSYRTVGLIDKENVMHEDHRNWKRTKPDANGWFRLKNYTRIRFLCIRRNSSLTVAGNHN